MTPGDTGVVCGVEEDKMVKKKHKDKDRRPPRTKLSLEEFQSLSSSSSILRPALPIVVATPITIPTSHESWPEIQREGIPNTPNSSIYGPVREIKTQDQPSCIVLVSGLKRTCNIETMEMLLRSFGACTFHMFFMLDGSATIVCYFSLLTEAMLAKSSCSSQKYTDISSSPDLLIHTQYATVPLSVDFVHS